MNRKPRIGLALGSGSARGWAHIGVLRELAVHGVEPDILCGASVGAFVGAAAARGDLERLERWACGLAWKDVMRLLDISWGGGLIKGEKLLRFFERHFVDCDFAALPLPFACVATDLETGREVWLREGSVAAAIRASIAMPGLLRPHPYEHGLLVDGGLVNPVPVSLCRALGADIVIAVDLGSDLVGSLLRAEPPMVETSAIPSWRRLLPYLARPPGPSENEPLAPSLVAVLTTSINIMQTRIARSRLAGDPAEVLVRPRLAQLGLLDFHRAAEAIEEGHRAVRRMLPAIRHALGMEDDT